MQKPTIPLFFAADDRYLPFLAVTLQSVKANADAQNRYAVHVLHAGIGEEGKARIREMQEADFSITFVNVSEKLNALAEKLQLRDYYTGATYYRIFIAELFPQYDKALYLDCDIVLTADVAELYNHDLGDCLVGAVPDETVSDVPVFCRYVRNCLGIAPQRYFNAGVLLMNLKAFRAESLYTRFNELLRAYKFTVAQDQDYLNVLCRDRVRYLSGTWDKMPIPVPGAETPKLIHYNLTRKPWHYRNVLYGEYFWAYARETSFYADILRVRDGFTEKDAKHDADVECGLIALAEAEADNPDNYFRTLEKRNASVRTA